MSCAPRMRVEACYSQSYSKCRFLSMISHTSEQYWMSLHLGQLLNSSLWKAALPHLGLAQANTATATALIDEFANKVSCAALVRVVQPLPVASRTVVGVLFLDQSTIKAAGKKELEKGKWSFRRQISSSTWASPNFPARVSRTTFEPRATLFGNPRPLIILQPSSTPAGT
jgi:hypothetical protein